MQKSSLLNSASLPAGLPEELNPVLRDIVEPVLRLSATSKLNYTVKVHQYQGVRVYSDKCLPARLPAAELRP